MKTIITPLAIAAIAIFSSCNKDDGFFCKKGNGDITIQNTTVSSFSKVDIQLAANVFLTQGSDYSVSVHASSNIQEYIQLDVHEDELEIEIDYDKCINDDDIAIYITSPTFSALKLAGGGSIKNTTEITSDNLKIKVLGSGMIDLTGLALKSYEIDVSGSGAVKLEGSKVTKGEIEISGSGEANSLGLSTDDLKIKVSGSGDASVNVVNFLNVKISGSGDVKYEGSPSVSSDISRSGSIKKI